LRHDAGNSGSGAPARLLAIPFNGSLICIVSVRPDREDSILSVNIHHHCQE
jgi:hypothetical protein